MNMIEEVAKRMFLKQWLNKTDTTDLEQVWDSEAPAAQEYMYNAALAIAAIETMGYRILKPGNITDRAIAFEWGKTDTAVNLIDQVGFHRQREFKARVGNNGE